MDSLLRDVRFAARHTWKDRGFSLTAILTLAVCIGANVAVFTVVWSVLLRPLPFPESDRFVLVANQYPNAGIGETAQTSVPFYGERLESLTALEEQALYDLTGSTVEIEGVSQHILEMTTTPSLFRVLQVGTEIGRTFVEADGEVEAEPTVILSYGLWQQLYGGDPSAIGAQMERSGLPVTIIGVMPPDFVFMDPDVRLWVSTRFSAEAMTGLDNRHSNNWSHIGRLKSDARIEDVQAQVDQANAAEPDRFPQFAELLINVGFHSTVDRLQDVIVRDVRGNLYLLWGGAAFVFLIGLLNLSNLALAGSNLRIKEFGTRLAVGATRGHILRQLVTEGMMVAALGGLAGLAVATGILRALSVVGLNELPRAGDIRIDGVVLGLTIGISVFAGLVISLFPALHILRVKLSQVLQEEGRSGTGGRSHNRIRQALVVTQVSVTCVLVIGAAVLLISFGNLLDSDPGFDSDNVLTASINAPANRYQRGQELRSLVERILNAFGSVPGVQSAGATTVLPFSGSSNSNVIFAEGYVMQPGESLIAPRFSSVTPGYFEAMGIDLSEGRYFEARDTLDAPGVVVIDERLAGRYWPDQSPVGRRMYQPSSIDDLLEITEDTRWFTVVGVVESVIFDDLTGDSNEAGAFYCPVAQAQARGMQFALKTTGNPPAVINSIRTALARIDPELPVFDGRTMRERLDLSLMSRRASMWLASAFAVVGLFLSAIGIYGILAYLVTQRSRDLGIRIALGSTSRQTFQLILREGLVLVSLGLTIGLGGAFALRRIIESQVYGVTPMDPILVSSVFTLVATIAVAASLIPAFRATRLNPATLLNEK